MSPAPATRRVLLVDGDLEFALAAQARLRGTGMELQHVPDATAGLRTISRTEPDVLLLSLSLDSDGGMWLLRRLRDDYMGKRPFIVVSDRADAVDARLAGFSVDGVLLKPASPSAISAVVAAACGNAADDLAAQPSWVRELMKLTVLNGDMEAALNSLAKRLSLACGTSDCVLTATVGEREFVGSARGTIHEEFDSPLWEGCRVSLDAGASVLVSSDTGVASCTAIPLEAPGGTRLGVLVLWDEKPRLFGGDVREFLFALGQRLYGELAWRSVHERIAHDNARLYEMSMLDPMLPGVWTRQALDQALAAEVAARQRSGEALTVAILDIRKLRALNDRHGHAAGDAVLKHVAVIVRQQLRPHDLLARYGGDSVAVVLVGALLADARKVVERLQANIHNQPLEWEGRQLPIQVVAGIATSLGEDDTGEATLARAAIAVKAAKRRREMILVAEETSLDNISDLAEGVPQGLEAGSILGGMYKIIHEIDRGAMGVVYRAEDLGLGRAVALKTLRPDLARDKSFVDRFRGEATTLAALRHENLVQVYSFGSDGDDIYFVMELVEGEPLEERINRAEHDAAAIPLDEVERIFSQVAAALDAMHHAGILHRDVKPANIVLDRKRDRAVLVDVGIAKRRGSAADPAGTPGFIAPESVSGGNESPRSDVYGLAATAYMAVSMAPPFGEGDVREIIARQLARASLPASMHRPDLPHAIDDVLARSLENDASKRHASAGEFAAALAQALKSAPPEVRAGSDYKPPGPRRETSSGVVSLNEPRHAPDTTIIRPTAGSKPSGSGPVPQVAAQAAPDGGPAGPPRRFSSTMTAGSMPSRAKVGNDTGPRAALKLDQPDFAPIATDPDAPPHTRGVLFRSAPGLLGAKLGTEWLREISKRNSGLGDVLQPRASLLGWHPSELFQIMLREIPPNPRQAADFARELGRVATAMTFTRFIGADPSRLKQREALDLLAVVWHRYHTWGRVRIDPGTPGKAHIHIAGGMKDELICAASAGILEKATAMAGLPSVTVSESACETKGASECVFTVRWQT